MAEVIPLESVRSSASFVVEHGEHIKVQSGRLGVLLKEFVKGLLLGHQVNEEAIGSLFETFPVKGLCSACF